MMRPEIIQFAVEEEEDYPSDRGWSTATVKGEASSEDSPDGLVKIIQDSDEVIFSGDRFGSFIIACCHVYVAQGGDPTDLMSSGGWD